MTHSETHFESSKKVRDFVSGMNDKLIVVFALTADLIVLGLDEHLVDVLGGAFGIIKLIA